MPASWCIVLIKYLKVLKECFSSQGWHYSFSDVIQQIFNNISFSSMVFSSPHSNILKCRISITSPPIQNWEVFIRKLKRGPSYFCHIIICHIPSIATITLQTWVFFCNAIFYVLLSFDTKLVIINKPRDNFSNGVEHQ